METVRLCDIQLIQLVGGQGCGKTELRRRMCPGAVDIGHSLVSMFNGEMWRAPGYWFDADSITLDHRAEHKLREWMNTGLIVIHQQAQEVTVTPNPGVWIVESCRPIDFQPSMIWEVDRCSS